MSLPTRTSPAADRRSTAPGTFHLLGDGESLSWSEPVYRVHGFEPGDVVPSVALMLAHCHRDDRPALEAALRGPSPAPDAGRSVRYRLLDAAGTERVVLAVLVAGGEAPHGQQAAGPATGDAGRPALGLLVDLGAEIGATAARRADDMLAAAIASREVIDQAKGAAMLAYGLDGTAAFELLRWHSEHLNVKVRTVAEHLLAAVPNRRPGTDLRDVLDEALARLAEVGAAAEAEDAATASPARLRVRHAHEGRSVLVRLDGEVDASTAPLLVAGMSEALRAVPARGQLILDASGVTRLGPVAALHVTRLQRRAEHAGVQLRVVPPEHARAEMRDPGAGTSMGTDPS